MGFSINISHIRRSLMDRNEIINRIGQIRIRANLSARALSTRIGKNEAYINRMETKKDYLPTIETLFDILEACGSSTEEFFYRDISSYKKDEEIINLLSRVSVEKKKAVITLLKTD